MCEIYTTPPPIATYLVTTLSRAQRARIKKILARKLSIVMKSSVELQSSRQRHRLRVGRWIPKAARHHVKTRRTGGPALEPVVVARWGSRGLQQARHSHFT